MTKANSNAKLSSRRMQDLFHVIEKAKESGDTKVLSSVFTTCNEVASYDLKARRVMNRATIALTEIHDEKYPTVNRKSLSF